MKKLKGKRRRERHRVAATTSETTTWQAQWLAPVLVVLLTTFVYLPALQNGFVNFDDDKNILTNLHYRGLGWSQLGWMFTTSHVGHYIPLTWMTLGLDYLLWGINPAGYHLTSVVLHSLNAGLFYLLAIQLLGKAFTSSMAGGRLARPLGAAFAALLFAVHPLRAESVAWVTERRDVLSGLFYLLAILAYLQACELRVEGTTGRRKWYWASVGCFGLALFSKSMAVSLLAVFVVLDVYPLRRLGWGSGRWLGSEAGKVWAEKIPYVLIAAAASLIAFVALVRLGNMVPRSVLGPADRVAISLYGLAFYLWKTLVPFQLSPLYQLKTPLNPLAWPFVLSGVVVLLISGLAIGLRRRFPALAAVWVSYVVTLLPVLGIFQNGSQIVADRYSYLSCLGWAILAGAGLLYCLKTWASGPRAVFLAAALPAVVVAGLAGLTWKQVQVWHDSETLWRHTIDIGQESSIGHFDLGVVLSDQGRMEDAIHHYRRALEITPAYVEAHNNLGNALATRGELEEAMRHYQRALKIDPNFAMAHTNLGNVFAMRGELEEAIGHFRQALRIQPKFPEAQDSLTRALALKRKRE